MPFLRIDTEDAAKALKIAGADYKYISRNDLATVVKKLEGQLSIVPAHIRIDDADIPKLIMGGQIVEGADVTAPVFTVLAPLDNAVSVAVSIQPAVTFGEQVIFGVTGSFNLFLVTGNVLVKSWALPSAIGSGIGQCELTGGNKVTLHPDAPLTAATAYYITWTAGAVRDLAGNNVAAQASATVWNFTTA